MGSREFRGQPCPLYVSITYKTMEDNSRNISLIGEVENSSRERASTTWQLSYRRWFLNNEVTGSVPTSSVRLLVQQAFPKSAISTRLTTWLNCVQDQQYENEHRLTQLLWIHTWQAGHILNQPTKKPQILSQKLTNHSTLQSSNHVLLLTKWELIYWYRGWML